MLSGRPLLDTALDVRLFVDRGPELAAIETAVAAGFNTVVVGVAGSGKTSTLRRIQHRQRELGRPVVFLDGLAVGAAARGGGPAPSVLGPRGIEGAGAGVAAGAVLQEIDRQLGGTGWSTETVRDGEPTAVLLDRIAGLERLLAGDAWAARTATPDRAVDGANSLARRPAAERRPLLVLDAIPSSAAGHLLFGRLRDELWRLPVSWLVAVSDEDAPGFLQPPQFG
jgi:hypothetical protein